MSLQVTSSPGWWLSAWSGVVAKTPRNPPEDVVIDPYSLAVIPLPPCRVTDLTSEPDEPDEWWQCPEPAAEGSDLCEEHEYEAMLADQRSIR